MLDIKLIREQPEAVRQRLATRGGGDESKIDQVLSLDEQRRKWLVEVEQWKASRNRVSKEIGALMAQKKAAEAEAKKTETRQMGERIAALDKSIGEVEQRRDALLLQLPNLPHAGVKVGRTAADNVEVRVWGQKAAFKFKPKTHVELCESLHLVDFARAAKISGSGFLLYTNWGARLERALIQFLLELHTGEHGYTEVSPPYLVNAACMTGVGQFPKFADQYYAVQEGVDFKAGDIGEPRQRRDIVNHDVPNVTPTLAPGHRESANPVRREAGSILFIERLASYSVRKSLQGDRAVFQMRQHVW